MRLCRACRGAVMLEAALVFLVFAVLLAGILELGIVGFAGNAVTYAARRAARYGALRGSASGHAATQSDIRATAIACAAPLSPSNLTVGVTWTPDNRPGSTVQVTVSFAFRPSVLPLASRQLSLQSTARLRIIQ